MEQLKWTERQEINEMSVADLKKGVMNKRVKAIKDKYSLTNEDLVNIFKENRKIMPDPKHWF